MVSVDCARSLNLVKLDRRISVCRNCLWISLVIYQQARMDCMQDFINFVQARTEATSKLSTEITLTIYGNVTQIQNKRYQITVESKMAEKRESTGENKIQQRPISTYQTSNKKTWSKRIQMKTLEGRNFVMLMW